MTGARVHGTGGFALADRGTGFRKVARADHEEGGDEDDDEVDRFGPAMVLRPTCSRPRR